MNGPRDITLRLMGSNPPRDFDSIDQALRLMGEDGWECFHLETIPGVISFPRITIRFKRVKEQ